jgi:hypothetical protein
VVGLSRVEAHRVEAFRVEAFRGETFRVEAFRGEAFRVEAFRVEALKLRLFELCSFQSFQSPFFPLLILVISSYFPEVLGERTLEIQDNYFASLTSDQ